MQVFRIREMGPQRRHGKSRRIYLPNECEQYFCVPISIPNNERVAPDNFCVPEMGPAPVVLEFVECQH